MVERTADPVDETLQRAAIERLLEWGFSREEITATLGHSDAQIREVQETQRITDPLKSTKRQSSSMDDNNTNIEE
jgi:hypothetical protein